MCFGLFSRSSASDTTSSSSSFGEIGNARPIDLDTLRRSVSPRATAHGVAYTPQQVQQQLDRGRPTIRTFGITRGSDEAHR